MDDDFVTVRRGGALFTTLRPSNNPDSKALKKRRATAIQQQKSLNQLPIETESSFKEASSTRATKIGFQPDPLTREQMLRHRLLTMEEETELGEAVHRGAQLKTRITQLMDEKAAAIESALLNNSKEGLDDKDMKSLSDLPYLMESQKLAASKRRASSSSQSAGGKTTAIGSFYYEQASSSLTDEEIINVLLLSGGRSEMLAILQKAKEARQTLITCNVKLVASIAKTWINRSKNNRNSIAQVYSFVGGWDVPSYDELLQEGILGLTRAVDKFDTTRKLRFSTYATYWIQSYIRRCLQVSATTCLKVPTGLHRFKASYISLINDATIKGLPRPTIEEAAYELGISPSRLQTALIVTQSLISIDAPLGLGNNGIKGSSAGNSNEDFGQTLLITDTLQCQEPRPEDFVELSFLRQCLENAMAAELSPHERDVIRLLFGLDDGQSRTVREVVDVCGGSVSMADIRNAERKAYIKLRSPHAMHSHNLLCFLDSGEAVYERTLARRRR